MGKNVERIAAWSDHLVDYEARYYAHFKFFLTLHRLGLV